MRSLLPTVLALCALGGCARRHAPERLIFAAYSAPREVYHRDIIPAFIAEYRARTGVTARVDESYGGSGAQSRAIAGGFEADVAALALAPDLDRLADAGLIQHNWRGAPNSGVVQTSLVVLAVRPGNPRAIHDFGDLARPGVEVIMPNPRISGGAMWNVSAMWGAELRRTGSAGDAEALLAGVLRNVSVMDRGARESILTFEHGIGDVALTYENEVAAGRAAGRTYEQVTPPQTLVIECPAALVDSNVELHQNRALAQAFVEYLHSDAAQAAFASHGFRRVDAPLSKGQFRIENLGGWKAVRRTVFAPEGVFARASRGAHAAR
jgi:sulfate transport system substrate-binding protein